MTTRRNLFNAQLFLDDINIKSNVNVTRKWHQVRKYPEPVLTGDQPWEHWCPVLYGTVLHFNDRFMMWYCTWTRKSKARCCYAESVDGVDWHKPELGICEFEGSKKNNVILESQFGDDYLIDDVSVIHDPDDEEFPLKMLLWDGGSLEGVRKKGIFAAGSGDGIHWKHLGEALPDWEDRFNAVCHKMNGKYVVLGRAPIETRTGSVQQGRVVFRSESEDLKKWSEPELVLCADIEDPPSMEIYSLVAADYEGITIGGIERMSMSPDKLDTELAWSYDSGSTWRRSRLREPLLPFGGPDAWDCAWANLASNVYIRHQNRLYFYYSGRSAAHVAVYPMNKGGVGFGHMRIDGFVSVMAAEREGCLITSAMTWPAAELGVNIDCRRDLNAHPGFCCGAFEAEVLGEDGAAIEGFARSDCLPMCTNTEGLPDATHLVMWQNDRSMKTLKDRKISLTFYLKDAHLYSYKAVGGN